MPSKQFASNTHKRHGRSSSMRRAPAIVIVAGSNPGSPACSGPVGNAPATAPFSNQHHHRYRQWMGGVFRRHIFWFFPCIIPKIHNTTLAATHSATGSASRRLAYLLIIFFFGLRV